MITVLAIIPWVLTVAALCFILVKGRKSYEESFNNDDEDFFFDDDDDDREVIRVAVYEDRAYWVHDNVFYESEVTREPDFTTARPIDTMSLPEKQLKKLLTILDDLENSERD